MLRPITSSSEARRLPARVSTRRPCSSSWASTPRMRARRSIVSQAVSVRSFASTLNGAPGGTSSTTSTPKGRASARAMAGSVAPRNSVPAISGVQSTRSAVLLRPTMRTRCVFSSASGAA